MAIQNQTLPTGIVTGSGTTGKLTKFNTATTIADSIVSESGAVLTTAGTQLSAVGAVGAPSYSYTGEANTGWYRSSAGVAGLSILGTLRWSVSATTATMAAGVTSTNTGVYLTGSINDFLQYDTQNTSTGTSAQATYSATADNGTLTTGFMSININNSTFTAVNAYSIGVANDTSVLGSGNDMYFANASTTKDIIFSLGKVASPFFDEFMRISRSLLQTVFTGTNGIRCITAATQDAMVIKGRAGGTTNLTATIIPGVLTASRTLTTPDVTGTIALAATTLAGYGITDGQPLNAKLTSVSALASAAGYLVNDGAGNFSYTTAGTVTGSGLAGTITKWTSGTAVGNSLLIDNVGTGSLTIVKAGVTARTVTFADAAISIPAGTILTGTLATTNRLDSTSAAGVIKESQIADGVTGNVLTIAGTLTATRSQLAQDKPGTIALQETSTLHGFKNLLHNGRVLVDQRATLTTAATVTTGTPTYGPDGYLGNKTNATMVATIGKVAVVNTPMVGSLDACKLNVTTLAAVAAGDSLSIQRRIEGTFFRRCNFGTAQAATVYVSFWAEASATGTFSVALRNGATGRSYVVNFTIAAANTRQLCQVTIPGDTTGTWAVDTTNAAFLDITAAVGATFQTTAGAWQAGNFLGTSSATILNNLIGSISISDLYLGTEPIGTATSDYPHIPADEELRRCLRYLPSLPVSSVSVSFAGSGTGLSATQCTMHFTHPVQPRVASTGLITLAASNYGAHDGTTNVACTALAWNLSGANSTTVTLTVAAGLTQYRPYFTLFSITAYILFTGAEL